MISKFSGGVLSTDQVWRGVQGCFLLLLVVVTAGCGARVKEAAALGLAEPEMRFEALFFKGVFPSAASPIGTLTAVVGVTNPNSVPVTLQHIEVVIRGDDQLRHERRRTPLGTEIGPETSVRVPVNLLFTLVGIRTRRSGYQLSPLVLTGKAFFNSAQGPFQVGFVRSMTPGERVDDGGGEGQEGGGEDDSEFGG